MNYSTFQIPFDKLKLILAVLMCMNSTRSFCQCFNTNQFPTSDVVVSHFSGSIDTISDESLAGHFVVLNNLIVGNSYTFNSSNINDFLSIRNTGGISSDPVVSFGSTPHTFIATSHTLEIHINLLSPPCGSEEINRTILISCNDCPIEPPKVGIQTASPKAILEVAGEIKIGDVNLNPEAGMIRYNNAISDFEGYNGLHWISLTKPNGNWGKVPSELVVEDQKLTADDGSVIDQFGGSISIDGNYAIIGSALNDIGSSSNQGSAYIFKRSGTSWTQEAKLFADDGAINDFFGESVSIDGDYAVIGSYSDDIGGNLGQGSAYIFKRSGTSWTQESKLIAGDGAADDSFGNIVSISGDYVVIGSDDDDIGSNSNQGSAYVFKRSGTLWTQEAKITAGDGAAADHFGESVSIDGDYTVIGSGYSDISGKPSQGSVYIFKRSGTSWTQEAKIIAADGLAVDHFGESVSISGNYAVIGSYFDDIDGNTNQGSAYIFKRSGTLWAQEAKLTSGDGAASDLFGISVSISGDYVVVGSAIDDIGDNTNQGSAYIFKRSGTSWTQETKLTAVDGATFDNFGISVSISGDYAAIGSDVGGNLDQGSAHVFLHK